MYGYSYPFNFSQLIDCGEGKIKVLIKKSNAYNTSLSSVIVTLLPVASLH